MTRSMDKMLFMCVSVCVVDTAVFVCAIVGSREHDAAKRLVAHTMRGAALGHHAEAFAAHLGDRLGNPGSIHGARANETKPESVSESHASSHCVTRGVMSTRIVFFFYFYFSAITRRCARGVS